MTPAKDFYLPEIATLQASLSLDMSSRTEEKYTYYLSSLRDIIRNLPSDWCTSTKSYLCSNPYCGPDDLVEVITQELKTRTSDARDLEVLSSVKNFAMLLTTVKTAALEV